MRKLVILAAVFVCSLLAYAVAPARKTPYSLTAVSVSPAETRQPVAPFERARAMEKATTAVGIVVGASGLRPRMPDQPPPPPATTWEDVDYEFKGTRPKSVAEMKLGPQQEAEYADPQVRDVDNYKLGVLDDLEDCTGGKLRGHMELTMWFDVEPGGQAGVGRDAELVRSSMSDADTAEALACVKAAHVGRRMESSAPLVKWGTIVAFPAARNPIYRTR